MRTTTAQSFSGNQAYWPRPQFSARKLAQPSLKVQLGNFFHTLVVQLTTSTEPRVWQSQDSTGHVLWNAYDAATDRVIRNASEIEVRVWLETRYQFN